MTRPEGADGVSRAAARIAALAGRLDDPEWQRSAAALVSGGAPDETVGDSFADLATAGLDLVEGLAGEGRWDEARDHAERLARHFHAMRRRLHPVAAIGFGGLYDAVRARDREAMDDSADLIREILGGGPA